MIKKLAILLLAALVPAILAAEQRAQVTGCVKDSSEAVLVDAAVTAINADTGIRRSARSNDLGAYVIASLPPGVYKITVRREGFQTIARLNVALNPAQNARVDFTMRVGNMRQVITIVDGPRLLNTDDGSVGVLIGREQIDVLPLNGRGVLSLLDIVPGVVATPATGGEAGQFSAHGQRANANYFTVDGVSANTSVSGGALAGQFAGGALPAMTAFGSTQNLVADEGIQEARIQTSSFAPEFGRMPGVHVGITTRAGSNELHGSVFYSFRNEKLDANDWFQNRHGLRAPESRLNDWGVLLGGPLLRDRTFFFASYEGLRLVQPFTWVSAVPSADARASAPSALRPLLNVFPQPNAGDIGHGLAKSTVSGSRPARLDAGSLRIDHALTARNSLFARYNQAPSSSAFGYSQIDKGQYSSNSLTLGLTSILHANLNNDLRLNLTRAAVSSRWLSTGAGGAKPVDLSKIFPGSFQNADVLYGFGIADVGEIFSGDSGKSRQGQWNVVETLTVNRAAHAIRFGADYERLTPARDRVAVSLAGRYDSVADLLAGHALAVTESRSDLASSVIKTLSFFAQDTWRIHPRFTVTYGTRWELTPAPWYRLPAASTGSTPAIPNSVSPYDQVFVPSPSLGKIWPTRYAQFAPRIGTAYRLSSQSVLRAGWGVFYDVNFSVATDPINGFPFNRSQFTAALPNPPVPVTNTVRTYSFAPNLKLPFANEWNVAYEHALSASDVLSLSYVGSSGRHLLRREGTLEFYTPTVERVVATNHGASRYNGLEFEYRRKMSHGLQGALSYAWSHSLDNGSWDSGVALVQGGVTAARDWGSSAFDVRHSFSAAFSWAIPTICGNCALRSLSHGWSTEGILRSRSGFPIDVLVNPNVLGLGFDNITRPDIAVGVPVWLHNNSAPGGRVLNPAAFSTSADTLEGNLGRDSVTGFSFSEADVGVRRQFIVRNESVLQVRIAAFNALNHPNFADPVRFLNHPLFGQATSMLNLMLGSGSPHSGLTPAFQIGGPRSIQISLCLRF